MGTPQDRKHEQLEDPADNPSDKPAKQPKLEEIDEKLQQIEAEQTLDNPAAGV
jgi:hypothetical protein